MLLICKNADNTIRWREGKRLDHLFEERCDYFAAKGEEGHLAVVTESGAVTFRDLDNRANQGARYLSAQGLGAGDRVGLLFDKSIETYVGSFGVTIWKRNPPRPSSSASAAAPPPPRKRAETKEPSIFSRHSEMVYYEPPQ
jgi:hypothetical protein